MLRTMGQNGHLASAVMVVYFIVLILISLMITYLTSSKRKARKKPNVKHVQVKNNSRMAFTPQLESVSTPKVEVNNEERQSI